MLALTSPIETIFHKIRVGWKLVTLAAATMGLFFITNLLGQLAAFAVVAALYLSGGTRFLRSGLTHLRPLWVFVAIIMAYHIVVGDAYGGAVITTRMMVAVALANLVTMTSRLDDMITVLTRAAVIFRPLGLRPGHLGLAISLFVRFTPVLTEKGTSLAESWRARSRKRPGWRLIVPMVLIALDDADHVAEALKARGGAPD